MHVVVRAVNLSKLRHVQGRHSHSIAGALLLEEIHRAAETQSQSSLNIVKTSGWISYDPQVSFKRAHTYCLDFDLITKVFG